MQPSVTILYRVCGLAGTFLTSPKTDDTPHLSSGVQTLYHIRWMRGLMVVFFFSGVGQLSSARLYCCESTATVTRVHIPTRIETQPNESNSWTNQSLTFLINIPCYVFKLHLSWLKWRFLRSSTSSQRYC